MINIRPVSDLRYKFPEIESALNEADYLAENDSQRMTHGEVFQALRKRNEKYDIYESQKNSGLILKYIVSS